MKFNDMRKGLLCAVALLMAWVTAAGQEFESRIIVDKQDCSFSFAVFADPHISIEKEQNSEDLRNVVADVNNNPGIAFVVVVGDVSDKGDYESLMHAKNILDNLKCRYYVIPGNHDTRWSMSGGEDFKRVFGDDKFRLQFNGYLFLGINSSPVVRDVDGHIAVHDVEWMKKQLKNIGRKSPVYLFSHYPLKTGDVDNWFDLTDVVRKHNVQAVVCGHYHRNMMSSFDGITGIMNRAITRGDEGGATYSMYEVCGDSLYVSDKRAGYVPLYWSIVPIEEKMYVEGDEKLFPRPDYTVNSAYKGIKERWNRNVGYSIYTSPRVDGSRVYFGDDKGVMHAYSLDKGKELWRFQSGGRVYGDAAVADGKVVFGSCDGNLYCLDTDDGKKLWCVPCGGAVLASPVVSDGVVYTGGGEGKFLAVSLSDGSVLWKSDSIGGVVVDGAEVSDDGSVTFDVMSSGGMFMSYRLDGRSGEVVAKGESAGYGMQVDGAVIKKGKDGVSAYRGGEEGTLLWCVPLDGRNNDHIIRDSDGNIVVSTKDGEIVCLEAATGRTLWRYKICNTIVNDPVQVSATDWVVTTADGGVVRLTVKR